jgi:hypothetical protein
VEPKYFDSSSEELRLKVFYGSGGVAILEERFNYRDDAWQPEENVFIPLAQVNAVIRGIRDLANEAKKCH